jgi:SAM-dependent methyltransferase
VTGRELFAVSGVPVLQNRTYATPQEARSSAVGDVRLVQEARTGLVSNAAFDPARLHYDGEYQNEQAHSGVFREHLAQVAALLEPHFRGRDLVEVGCGKGFFLRMLRERGYRVAGIDPAYEGDDPDIITAPFERGLGLSAQGIVLRHTLEHMRHPVDFLAGILHANGGRGDIYIEVPCFDWIRLHRAWFDIFYEHVNYFRLDDFRRMFGTVHDCGHVFGGQYLYVIADLASLREPVAGTDGEVTMPADFLSRLDTSAHIAANAARNAVWGASSKGVIFSVHLARARASLALAIDINPAKQGRYLPVTGLPVVAPDTAARTLHEGDHVFVMNSNYYDEIRRQSANRYRYTRVDHE